MTKPEHPVVEALELTASLECSNSVRVLGVCVPCAAKDALPLARQFERDLAQAQAELREAREQANTYLRQVEDVKCAMLRNPQEEFDVGVAVDEMRGQKESAEAKVKEQTLLLAILDCDEPIKAAAAKITQLEAKNAELAAQVAVLVAKLKQVDSHFNLPAEAEKLVRVVEAAKDEHSTHGLGCKCPLCEAIRDLQDKK